MKASDAAAFAEFVTALAVAFGREADRPLLMAYKMGLEDLPIEAIGVAVKRAMRECKFMPAPAELRELAGVIPAKARAVLAWEAFDAAVQAHGYYQSVDFDDPLINATVRNLGGWVACCDKPLDEWQTFFRKDFERVYQNFIATGASSHQCQALTGYYASQNTGSGQPVNPPVRIETGLPPLIGLAAPQSTTPLLESR